MGQKNYFIQVHCILVSSKCRFLHERSFCVHEGCDVLISKLRALEFKMTKSLAEKIVISDLGINAIRNVPTYFDQVEAAIYIDETINSSISGPYIGQHLASYFEVSSREDDLKLILLAPDDQLIDLSGFIFQNPELPEEWLTKVKSARLELGTETETYDDVGQIDDDDKSQAMENNDISMSSEEAIDIINFINQFDDEMDIDVDVADSQHLYDDSTGPRKLDDEDVDPSNKLGKNMKSGFAGEFFVCAGQYHY